MLQSAISICRDGLAGAQQQQQQHQSRKDEEAVERPLGGGGGGVTLRGGASSAAEAQVRGDPLRESIHISERGEEAASVSHRYEALSY
jgi:hypothetical protein